MTAAVTSPDNERPRAGLGLFGGALAWLIHLVAASIISEWGCVSGLHRYELLGITAIAWSVIVLSIVALAAAAAATWAVYRLNRHYHELGENQQSPDVFDVHGTDAFLARVGLWTSGLFVFIIAVQSFPILYFLTEC